jgi:hydroxymethylglutaryl-CoA reductase
MHCTSMVKRGGGVIAVRHRRIFQSEIMGHDSMVVELLIDVKEAMGANLVNTVCEKIAPYIQSLLENSKIGLRILTNLCTERMARSEFKIPVEKLKWKGLPGKQVALGILQALEFAQQDVY